MGTVSLLSFFSKGLVISDLLQHWFIGKRERKYFLFQSSKGQGLHWNLSLLVRHCLLLTHNPMPLSILGTTEVPDTPVLLIVSQYTQDIKRFYLLIKKSKLSSTFAHLSILAFYSMNTKGPRKSIKIIYKDK